MKNKKSPESVIRLINTVASQMVTKRGQKGLKLLSKHADLSYLMGLPSLVASAIMTHVNKIADKNEINVVIDTVSKQDCIDHLRWLALIPYILNQPSLKINVIALVDDINVDQQTQFRNVIDYIIIKELDYRFTSKLVEGDISDIVENVGIDNIDLCINNVPSCKELMNESSVSSYKQLIANNVPVVISDVSPLTLMYRIGAFNLCGMTANEPIITHDCGIKFSRINNVQYSHFGYSILINEYSPFYNAEELSDFATLEKCLVARLEQGDPLKKLPYEQNGTLHLFGHVEIDLSTYIAKVSHFGAQYSLRIQKFELPDFLENNSSVQEQVKLLSWALSVYQYLVLSIEESKKGVA